MKNKVLVLVVTKRWFDMIESGEKKEEYREIKPFWEKRLRHGFDLVEFRNGYQRDARRVRVKFEGLALGLAKKKWSGGLFPDPCFIIKLGQIQ